MGIWQTGKWRNNIILDFRALPSWEILDFVCREKSIVGKMQKEKLVALKVVNNWTRYSCEEV